jgi:hypothetical protein
MLLNARHVILSTGFACNNELAIATESDGPPGILILAYTLLKQDPSRSRRVTLVADQIHSIVFQPLVEYFNAQLKLELESDSETETETELKLEYYEFVSKSESDETPISTLMEEEFFNLTKFSDVDVMIASELSGFNKQMQFKTMSNRDISAFCGLTAHLFDYAFKYRHDHILTIGIGDGGNEVGMGKYIHNIEKYITNGDQIACNIQCHCCITAGVRNWAAEALAVAIAELSANGNGNGNTNGNMNNKLLLCDDQFHHQMYFKTSQFGAMDGITKKGFGSVDGLAYQTHAQIWKQMSNVRFKLHQRRQFRHLTFAIAGFTCLTMFRYHYECMRQDK